MKFKSSLLLALPLALGALSGCTREGKFQPVDMWNDSRLKPYEGFHFFGNESEAQVPPTGTIARSQNRVNEPLYYGTQNGALVTYNPLTQGASAEDRRAILQRGQERYQVYCQPCHGLAGYGDGLIIKRGFAAPPSYHLDRLRNAADGHIYDVIANGYGSMYSYASRVPPKDRWAIVAYIRALQLSQRAPASAIPAGQKVPAVVPPIDNSEKYIGAEGGGAYNDAGKGNESNSQYNNADKPNVGETDKSRPIKQPSSATPTPSGSTLVAPGRAETEAKSSVTTPSVPSQER